MMSLYEQRLCAHGKQWIDPLERCGCEAEATAMWFHDTYERLAPQFGYETRADTRQFDPKSANGRLMIAVCALLAHQPAAREPEGQWVSVPRDQLIRWEGWVRVRGEELTPPKDRPSFLSDRLADEMKAMLRASEPTKGGA